MSKLELKSPKLPYSPPQLKVYGSVQKLTQARLTSGRFDGTTGRFGQERTAI